MISGLVVLLCVCFRLLRNMGLRCFFELVFLSVEVWFWLDVCCNEYDGEIMVRLFGCGLLVLMFVLMGWVVEYYVEVWNLFEVW